MKVLNLQCQHGHAFEGWFGSHEDYADQRKRGLVSCPVCNDDHIVKLPSAPRLNLGASETVANAGAAGQGDPAAQAAPGATREPAAAQALAQMPVQQLQAAWMKMVRHVMAQTEDVGTRFADEARKIHHGEAPNRGIRGQASRADTEALLDEGIEILPLPIPPGLKEPLQ